MIAVSKIIVKYPNKILRNKTKDIEITDHTAILREFKPKFTRLLYAAKVSRGVGIAAPQIGISESYFVFKGKIAVNPKIIAASDEKESDIEGCLSLNDRFYVPRSKNITVEYYNAALCKVTADLTGFEARVFQHEIDHLNGKLILDYAEAIN